MKNSTKNKFIIYSFTPNDILVNASGITSVLGASRSTENGDNLFDYLSLSEDDRILIQQFIKEAVTEINLKLLAYSCDIFISNKDDLEEIEKINFQTVLPPNSFDQIIDILNNYILNFITYYLIYSWLIIKKPDEASVYFEKSMSYINGITGLLNKRKSIVKRKCRWF
ncbi:hypothetical protein [Coprobacter sp.]|uniref:hypothetical protein n=1 Tax=Coprobacter sp. TaxID=1941478 RepID=UPI003AB4F807